MSMACRSEQERKRQLFVALDDKTYTNDARRAMRPGVGPSGDIPSQPRRHRVIGQPPRLGQHQPRPKKSGLDAGYEKGNDVRLDMDREKGKLARTPAALALHRVQV